MPATIVAPVWTRFSPTWSRTGKRYVHWAWMFRRTLHFREWYCCGLARKKACNPIRPASNQLRLRPADSFSSGWRSESGPKAPPVQPLVYWNMLRLGAMPLTGVPTNIVPAATFSKYCGSASYVVEMQDQIRTQGLDLQSTMDRVASRTQDLIGSSGVVVGLLEQDTLLYPVRLGIAVTMTGLPSQAKLFHSCISKGTVLLLPDAQGDPAVGASCRREGVRSLIVLPIFNHREVAGAMELLFKGRRSFSTGEVMTLELIADLVGGRLAGVSRIDATQPEAHESPARLRIIEDIEPQGDHAVRVQTRLSFSQYSNSDMAPGAPGNLELSIPDTIAVLPAKPVPCKPVWIRLP